MSTKQLPVIGKVEEEKLQLAFDRVNNRYFNKSIVSKISWGVPQSGIGRVAFAPKDDGNLDGVKEAVSVASKFANSGDYVAAINALIPLADSGNDTCMKAIITISSKANLTDIFSYWSKKRNSPANILCLPSASSIEKIKGEWGHIRVHPNLSLPRTPPKVLKYVIYHEMLHEHLDSDPSEPHSEIFLKHEKLFAYGADSREFLRKKGYSVHNDE
jgi:hypothetical protein